VPALSGSGLKYISQIASSESNTGALVKHLERIANVAIIVAVAVFLTLVIRGNFFPHTPSAQSRSALVGKTISVPGIHFSTQRDSLVLGLSTACHFCNESMPFYKGLVGQLHGSLDVIAVLPQTKSEAEHYLKTAGLSEASVVSSSLDTIGIYATPTLLLVDSTGKVKSEWVGKLDDATQRKILAAVLSHAATVVHDLEPERTLK
jgi:hypothetical protein